MLFIIPNQGDGGFMQYKNFEIIDFHTHPFVDERNNICSHTAYCNMSIDGTKKLFDNLRVSHICGSVLTPRAYRSAYTNVWERILDENEIALQLRNYYQGFYIPGFHVHPDYVEESIGEIRRMHELGVRLIGELCPYFHGWKDYSCDGFSEILDEAEKYGMVVNCHSMGEDEMDQMVKAHPGVIFVAAHPGEYGEFIRHMERMRMSENYYLDLSGYGIFRHGMLRHAIDEFGPERFLFGSDYPTCNPAMYIGGVLLDDLITDEEKELIFSKNARRLLNLR
jgi:predicted TIM-barrel fold metal-dependent hydrolase